MPVVTSRAADDIRYDVIVVGLGPVGTMMALLLGRLGLSVAAIEPEHGVYPLPRAAHVDHEIMRLFQSLGLVEAIAPHVRVAPDYEFRNGGGEALMRVERAGRLGASGWPVSFNLHQPGVEVVVRSALEAQDNVDIVYGARFAALAANDAQGVAVDIAGAQGPARLAARFLVGCDGAWSPVREACGIALDDYAFDEPWLVVDAQVPDESRFPEPNLQICDPDRPTTFVHMGPGRLRWEFMLKPDEDAEAMKTDAALDRLLATWRRRGAMTVERRAVYRFHGLVACDWRRGGTFLVGDAAHQMPPFMGQGLCSGLRDAANLSWKLAAVLDGARDDLLDSYQREREPHVRFVIEKAIEMGRVVCTLDPAAAAARDAEMLAAPQVGTPAAFPRLADGCVLAGSPGAGTIFPQAVDAAHGDYLDDRLGAGAWLIHRGAAPAGIAGVAIVDLDRDVPAALRPPVAAWLAEHDADAVLVRPDRYVFGSGNAAGLIAAYAARVAVPDADAERLRSDCPT